MNLINESNPEKAKSLIKKAKEKPVIVQARDYNFNRKIIEYGKFDILLSPEVNGIRDKLRYTDSGIDSICAKLASKNKIAIGINIEELSRLNKKEKAVRIARIIQNIKLCRKAKCKIVLLNYKDKKDAQSLLTSLGASTQQVKEALSLAKV